MVMQSSAAVMIWQRARWRHPDTPVPSLQTLIEIFRDWQCTDLRDKVFTLSGMVTEESTVEPDYALTTQEVYFAVLRHIEDRRISSGHYFRKLSVSWVEKLIHLDKTCISI